MDENRIQYPRTSSYLSATELMSFRKGYDEQFSCIVGQKLYKRTRTYLEEQALECVLESHKDTLDQKRASRICDLMQAEWNKDLNLAIISKLKGKYAHHMGHTIDGKIGFSPEEAMFLLENRAIEIMNDKMPMSTEEGYAIMLKGSMGIEKYRVYSHLSQLGFIVVRHQIQLETVSGEKITDMNKHQTTRKRKPSADLPEVRKEKRLTFAGALSCHKERENNEIEMSNFSMNREENSTSSDCQFLKINDTAVCSETLKSTENAVSSTTNENEGIKSAEPLSFACASQNFGDNEKRTIGEGNAEVVALNVIQTEAMVDKMQLTLENAALSSVSTVDKGSKNVDHSSLGESRESITVESTADGNSNEILIHDSRDKNSSATRENDVMLPDSCNAIGITSGEESIEITDGGSNQERSYFQDQDDFMSCSSEDNESDVESFDGDSSKCIVRKNAEDDEVTLLEVKKKETKPLAVIDLLSDEEQGNMEVEGENAQSDDEIQIVKVCAGSSSCKSSARKTDNRNYVVCKKEENADVLLRSQKLSSHCMQFPFPDLFRKEVACLARPPSFLLPRNVRPAKEAYILDFKRQCNEQTRIWNSYRELQDYQRARRRGMMPNPSSNTFHRFVIRRTPDFRQNHDSSWDHQSQTFNHHEQNDNQTVSSSQSRDFDGGSFSSGRDNYGVNSLNNDVTSSSSSLLFRRHERSVGLFGVQQPAMFSNTLLPLNIPAPNFHNMFSSNDLISELHRTAYGVASNLLTAMLSQNMIPTPLLEFQAQQHGRTINFNDSNHSNNLNGQRSNGFMNSSANSERRSSPQNLMGCNSFGRNTSADSSYPRQRFNNSSREEPSFLLPLPSGRRNRRDFRQRNYANRGKPFPCPYSHLNNKSSWNEVKAVVDKRNEDDVCGNDSNSDIEEVPVDVNQVLWSNDIQPLVKPGMKRPISEVLQSLKVTQMAKLLSREIENERYLPTTSHLEIAFDVYLPATNYKKTCPGIPKHRVIVVRSTDPFPKYSEIVHLQKKWNDGACLQLAVVDNGDISFFSFNSISLPVMIPHEP